jgi:ribosomal protein S18 acetylase RimI-like enzyme
MVEHMPWTLRDAEEGDLSFLRLLYGSVRQDLQSLPDEMREPLLELQFQAQRRGYGAQYPQARQELIEVGGMSIGQLLTARLEADLVLVDFSLLPDWRGQGIGGAVLQTLQTRAQAASCGIRLQVARDNPALHLYARHGFATFAGDELRHAMRWDGSHESLNGTSA